MYDEPYTEETVDDDSPIQDDLVFRLLQNKKVKSLLDKLHNDDTAQVLIEMLDTMEKAVGRDLITAEQTELVEVQAAMKIVVGLNHRLKRLLSLKETAAEQQDRDVKTEFSKTGIKNNGHW